MLSKCIGIISGFPDEEPVRTNRKKSFDKLIRLLDTYFHLPIVVIAQNWRKEDFKITYNSNTLKVYSYSEGLGITCARITLREALLKENYDYFIFLDDDSNVICNQDSVNNYLLEVDNHPDMVGKFKNRSGPRLLAISKSMLEIMDYDYIKDLEAYRGEIWEDVAYIHTYEQLYPKKFYSLSPSNMNEVSPMASKDTSSTWYQSDFGNETLLRKKTFDIIPKGVAYKKEHN